MTNQERNRLMNLIRASKTTQPNEAEVAKRRKLDRDLDRIERALTACLYSEASRQRRRDERKRWREFEAQFRKRAEEAAAFAARFDKKLKTIKDDIRKST
jgi:hypothetical protein